MATFNSKISFSFFEKAAASFLCGVIDEFLGVFFETKNVVFAKAACFSLAFYIFYSLIAMGLGSAF